MKMMDKKVVGKGKKSGPMGKGPIKGGGGKPTRPPFSVPPLLAGDEMPVEKTKSPKKAGFGFGKTAGY